MEAEYVFHVTHAKSVSGILADGIVTGRRRNWSNAFGVRLGRTDHVYAMTTPEEAARWGCRMEFDLKTQAAIVIVANDGSWERDEAVENWTGLWLQHAGGVEPKRIVAVVPVCQRLDDTVDRISAVAAGLQQPSLV